MAYLPVNSGTIGDGDWSGWTVSVGNGAISVISGTQFLSENPEAIIPADHPSHLDMSALTILRMELAENSGSTQFRTGLVTTDVSSFKNTDVRWYRKNTSSMDLARVKYLTDGPETTFLDMVGSRPFGFDPVGYDGYNSGAADPADIVTGGSLMAQWEGSSGGTMPADLADITRLVFQVDTNASGAAEPAIIYLFDWLLDYAEGTIIDISWDDAHPSQFEFLLPDATEANLPQTLGIIFNDEAIGGNDGLDTPGYMTSAQLDIMFANDLFDVTGHSITNFQDMTTAEVLEYLDDVVAPGMVPYARKGGLNAWIYAQGGFQVTDPEGDEIRDLIASRGKTFARTTQTANYESENNAVDQQLRRPSLAMGQQAGNVTDSASALAEVDRAIAAGLNLTLNAHQITEGAPTNLQWNRTELQDFFTGLNTRITSGDITVESLIQRGIDFGFLELPSSAVMRAFKHGQMNAQGLNQVSNFKTRGASEGTSSGGGKHSSPLIKTR